MTKAPHLSLVRISWGHTRIEGYWRIPRSQIPGEVSTKIIVTVIESEPSTSYHICIINIIIWLDNFLNSDWLARGLSRAVMDRC